MGGHPRLPGQRRVKFRIKYQPRPGEVGGAKLYRDSTELRLN